MRDLLIYLGFAACGYILASQMRRRNIELKWISPIMNVSVLFLIFLLGLRFGSNQEVIHNLNSIGIYAAAFTLTVFILVITSLFLMRKLLGIDHFGHVSGLPSEDNTAPSESPEEEPKSAIDSMTIYIIITVSLGLIAGYLTYGRKGLDTAGIDSVTDTLIVVGLCIILFSVGISMGFEGTIFSDIRKTGIRALAIPAVNAAASLAAACIMVFFLPVSLRESLAIGAGFGWYTLAPIIIMGKGHVMAGAISFMHNITRELFSIFLIPLIANKIGYVEASAISGAASMDVCLPIVARATNSASVVYAFINGIVMSALVPVLVPLLLG